MRRPVRGAGVKLPRVHRVTRGDKVHCYHRRTRARLPDLPESHPEFLAAWLAEEQRQRPAVKTKALPGSIAAGCEAYLDSTSFRELSEGYRPVIRRHVEKIKEQGGNVLLRYLEPHHVRADIEPLKPAVASSRMKAWRKLGEFWVASGKLRTDPTDGVKRKKLAKTGGHREWTRDNLETFRERWPIGTPQRLAGELLQWTGARCVDAVKLGPGMVGRDGLLTFVQHKTKHEAHIPWVGRAFGLEADRLALMQCIGNAPGVTFIVTGAGKPRSVKGFSQWFAEAAREAGLVKLTAHGLRKYRMNALAEAGASVLVMQSWVGHVTLDEVQEYTRKADRRKALRG